MKTFKDGHSSSGAFRRWYRKSKLGIDGKRTYIRYCLPDCAFDLVVSTGATLNAAVNYVDNKSFN